MGTLMIVLGLDSLVVGLGLGAAVPRWDRLRLAAAFAACDGLAALLGAALGGALPGAAEWAEWLGPAAVGGYGLFVLYLAWQGRRAAERGGRWLALGLPLCLSLDNFFTGAAAAAGGPVVPSAVGMAVVSGAMALAGLAAGAAVADRATPRAGWIAGAVLLLAAAGLAVKGALT
jgi:putative Mn2+ efflux pump MntP